MPFLACGLQWLLWDPWIKPYVWFLFFPVAFFAAWLGGVAGGIAATLVSAGLVWFVFIPPHFSFALSSLAAGFSIAVFVVMGGLFTWLFERLRRTRMAADSRFEATFEQAAVGIALVAPDGRWLRVNRKLCAIVGYTPDEMLTKTFQDITHPDDLDADLDQVRRMLAREIDTYTMEKRYIRKDGGLVWIDLTVSLTWKPDGTPDYFISVVEDISARKTAEADALTSQERLREAKQLAGLGHWYWDLQTDVHIWSEEIYALYGRDPSLSPAVYPEVRQYFTQESWAKLAATVEQALAEGMPYECDAEVMRPDASRRWITARGQASRDHDGKVIALQGTVQDITARKQAELRFRQLFDLAPIALSTSGRDGRILLMNRAFIALFGYTVEATPTLAEFRRRAQPDAEARQVGDQDWQRRWQSADTQLGEPHEQEMVCADGTHKTVLTSRMRLGEEMILAVVDITAQKTTEAELRRRNEELERFDRASIGRELEMIRLKGQVNALGREMGREAPYDLSFLAPPDTGAAP